MSNAEPDQPPPINPLVQKAMALFGALKTKLAEKSSKSEKKKKKGEVSWRRKLVLLFVEIATASFSKDAATRWMSVVFFASVAGSAWIGLKIFQKYQMYALVRAERLEEQQASADSTQESNQNRQVMIANRKAASLTLGKFSVQLKLGPGEKAIKGFNNLADITVILMCDSKETKAYLQDKLQMAQDQVTIVFQDLTREEILSFEGKRRVKNDIVRRINQWMTKGRIEEIYISDLLIS
ncbi:MAG: flagellar basal body-associated FliL family protein [Bdellovibrionota bacterium]